MTDTDDLFEDFEEGPPAGVDPAEWWASEYRKIKTYSARLKFLQDRGELIKKEEVERLLVDRATEFKRGLETLEQALPPRLLNRTDPREIQAELAEAFRRLLDNYARAR